MHPPPPPPHTHTHTHLPPTPPTKKRRRRRRRERERERERENRQTDRQTGRQRRRRRRRNNPSPFPRRPAPRGHVTTAHGSHRPNRADLSRQGRAAAIKLSEARKVASGCRLKGVSLDYFAATTGPGRHRDSVTGDGGLLKSQTSSRTLRYRPVTTRAFTGTDGSATGVCESHVVVVMVVVVA